MGLSTELINEAATNFFRKAAHSSGPAADDDGAGVFVSVATPTNAACPECKRCTLHCVKDGLWRSRPGKFYLVLSPSPVLASPVPIHPPARFPSVTLTKLLGMYQTS